MARIVSTLELRFKRGLYPMLWQNGGGPDSRRCRMQVNRQSGLLDVAEQVESPNQDDRPEGVEPELIVIHCISLPPGEFGGPWVRRFFCNELPANRHPYFAEIRDLAVSSHLMIARDGQIDQFVPFNRRAWHAGTSEYCGRSACNDFSIGIELEGTDDGEFEDLQYQKLADVVATLCSAYPSLSPERMTGHSDIAPGRKSDPGPGFDWDRLRGLLQTDKKVAIE